MSNIKLSLGVPVPGAVPVCLPRALQRGGGGAKRTGVQEGAVGEPDDVPIPRARERDGVRAQECALRMGGWVGGGNRRSGDTPSSRRRIPSGDSLVNDKPTRESIADVFESANSGEHLRLQLRLCTEGTRGGMALHTRGEVFVDAVLRGWFGVMFTMKKKKEASVGVIKRSADLVKFESIST